MNISAVIVTAMFIAGCIYLIHEDAEAMAKCQEKYSEETCFYQLNH